MKSNNGKTTHQCSFTSTDGWVYDLSPLTKPDGVEDYHVRFEKQQYSLTLNICSNVDKTKLEPSCKQHLQNGELSPVYQTNDPGKSCYYLGNVDKPKWEVMDTTNPRKGVVLTYTDGQQCGVRGKRSVSYHMVCANNFLSFEPPSFAYESPICHYNIVWPTIHACPTSVTGPGLSTLCLHASLYTLFSGLRITSSFWASMGLRQFHIWACSNEPFTYFWTC